MPKATADVKKAAEKGAVKALAAKGVTKPKHVPGESAPGVKGLFPAAGTPRAVPPKPGVDTNPSGVGQSEVASDTTNQGKTMNAPTNHAESEKKLADEKAAAKVAAMEKAKADKAAKLEAATREKEAKALERKAALEKQAEARKAKQEQTLEQKKAAAEAAGSKRTYYGSMTALAERVKNGVYTKGLTGQLRSSDELALALDAVPTDNVVKLGVMIFGSNPYAHLNRGQQSMNFRNKMRGAIKADDGKGMILPNVTPEQRVTLDYIKHLRDENNFATAEDAAAKKAEAKAKREAEASAKKAAAEAEKAKKVAEKAAAKEAKEPAAATA